VALGNLLVDTGLLPRQVSELVRVGDVVSFAQPPVELSGETLSGHSLDNRASVAALTICLEELQSRPHNWDVWAVASSQEEVGALGAAGSAFELRPTIAIVVDVTWAKGPGTSDWNAFPAWQRPDDCNGAKYPPGLAWGHERTGRQTRNTLRPGIYSHPLRYGRLGHAGGRGGYPDLVLGIPLRYMHTPVEVVSIKDIQRAGRLLAEFIGGLGPDFMTKMVWDK
jgi:putative aminopeptidase FrvX